MDSHIWWITRQVLYTLTSPCQLNKCFIFLLMEHRLNQSCAKCIKNWPPTHWWWVMCIVNLKPPGLCYSGTAERTKRPLSSVGVGWVVNNLCKLSTERQTECRKLYTWRFHEHGTWEIEGHDWLHCLIPYKYKLWARHVRYRLNVCAFYWAL